jgi:iron complex outermembrane receptor protein
VSDVDNGTARGRGSKLALALLGGVALSGLSGMALAATAGAGPTSASGAGSTVGEVIVTARRVEENLQKTPVAVAVVSSTELREKAITTPIELQFNVPSLQNSTTFGRIGGGFAVRGIAGGTTSYFAEVAGGPTEPEAPFYDIGSVQVLNGPQGTLFGRTNIAGAVLITPAKPDASGISGFVDVSVGSLGLNRDTAVFNLPIDPDHLAVRVALNRDHLDGYTKVIGSGQGLNETNNYGGRISVDWRPGNGKFHDYAVLDYMNIDEGGPGYVLGAVNPGIALFHLPVNINAPSGLTTGTAIFGAACNTAVANGLQPDVNTCINQRLMIAATFLPALTAEMNRINAGGAKALDSTPGNGTLNLPPKQTLNQFTFVNQTEYDFGDLGFTTVSFRNILGVQAVNGSAGWSVDGAGGIIESAIAGAGPNSFTTCAQQVTVPGGLANVSFCNSPYQYTITEEPQLRGVLGHGLISWNVGFYYQNTPAVVDHHGIRNVARVFDGITLPTLGFNPSFAFEDGGYTLEEAVYGQGTLDLSRWAPFIKGLHLTGGVRDTWDWAETDQLAVTTNVATGAYVPGAAVAPVKTSSSGINTTIDLDAQVTDDLLVYGTTRTAYVPGGLNTVLNGSGLPNYSPTFGPELVTDYELGAKVDFHIGDARARIDAALYQTSFTNIQVGFQGVVNGVSATYTGNAAAAKIQGLELQGEVVSHSWDFSGNYAYTDAKFTKWLGADPLGLEKTPGSSYCVTPPSTATSCVIDLGASPYPYIPKHQGSITAKYYLPLSDSIGRVSLSATAYFQSRMYLNNNSGRNIQAYAATIGAQTITDAQSQKSFGRFNLRADWRNVMGSQFSLAAFVNNLADYHYAISGVSQLQSLGTISKLYGEPRTFGVELRYQFGHGS